MSKSILVVDDDDINLKLADFILAQQGYEVHKAYSGEEGIDILNSEDIDLVLLDIEMPRMSGLETLERIRADYRFENTPVIFLTAITDTDNVVEASKLGALGYIKKPFMPQELLDRVRDIFS